MQPEELFEYDLIWSPNQGIKTYRQHLAKDVLVRFSIFPVKTVEPILAMSVQSFPGKIWIKETDKVIEIVKKLTTGPISLFSDMDLS